ncbi:probable ascorbate-specific transmembrane electron transporter 1 [Gossypium hirsutum]|uniref:Probable ascorbate-specific transmembrane electron transporter 1 n=1 Tax=Gossypium hirsutum TaxID=3635 RepID=A0ABM3APD0_GOSHI|nr:probable ascorbate-specific transmembrane electron transporter 1 [Gossypium hirsutum]
MEGFVGVQCANAKHSGNSTSISHEYRLHCLGSHYELQVIASVEEVKKVVHLVLHDVIALILGIIGIYAAFKYHNESSIANLYSLHSWLGIGIIVLYGIQLKFKVIDPFKPSVLKHAYPAGLRRESLPWHVVVGLFVYILAVANAAIGFLEKLTFLESSGLAKYGAEAYLVNFTAIVTILYGALVIFIVFSKAPQDDDFSYIILCYIYNISLYLMNIGYVRVNIVKAVVI